MLEHLLSLEPTLPGYTYLNPAFFERERENIFFREWIAVAREEDLPHGGDFLQLDILGQSILLVRGKDSVLRGFYNVCRHRGCQLSMGGAKNLAEPGASGHFNGNIQCPYHAWAYDFKGKLRTAPYLQNSLDREQFSLYPVGVDSWGGFVFVNLDPATACTLKDQLGQEIAYSQRYPLAELRRAHRLVYDVAANWKVIIENYNECYHCAGVHPELCDVVPAFRENGGSSLDWGDGVPHKPGAYTFTFSGATSREPFPGLNAEEQVKHKAQLIFPNLLVSLSCDHVAAFTLWPLGADRTHIVCDFLFHPNAIEKPDFDPMDAVAFWDLVNRQDWVVCEGVQRGMQTRVFEQGYYAPMEDLSADMRRYIAAKLGEI